MSFREVSRTCEATDLDEAIWRTVAYAGLFQYPLRLSELQRRLVDVAAGEEQIAARLAGRRLVARLSCHGGFIQPAGAEDWVPLRERRAEHTLHLLARHDHALRAVARFPFVRMAALSGACAHGNAADDDVDVFLITRASRAWTVTLLLMVAAKLAGLRRTLCVNYVLGEEDLQLPERDRFTASEIVGMRPLAGRSTYRRFVQANEWAAALHPNFFALHERESEGVAEAAGAPALERTLDRLGAGVFERFARAALGRYLRGRVRGADVVLAGRRLKLHAHGHRDRVNGAFEEAAAAPRGAEGEPRPEARTA